jgi:3-phosphoglycerate kinase
LQDRVSHVSSADDATLKLLEGCELPGLEALRAAVRRRTIIQSV